MLYIKDSTYSTVDCFDSMHFSLLASYIKVKYKSDLSTFCMEEVEYNMSQKGHI